MHLAFENISERLSHFSCTTVKQSDNAKRAAVAMILHRTADDIEILFIQRALHKLDPWSGHIAFPGGKLEKGERVHQAVCRETFEEIGVDLTHALYLGRLPDIMGANLPVCVSCSVFGINRNIFNPRLNDEVSDLFWVTLSELSEQSRHVQRIVHFEENSLEVPAIVLPKDDKPVLWGITYRLVMQFMELL